MEKTSLTQLLDIKYPIIMAPMFLVTNTKMMINALNCDIAGCIPALNYRTDEELRIAIKEMRKKTDSTALGINLIVNKSNFAIILDFHFRRNLKDPYESIKYRGVMVWILRY